jgi:lipopolysaccharide transport system permease protein
MSGHLSEGVDLSPEPGPARELLRDTWRSRGLIAILARQDFFVRYRRAGFGIAWAAALPLLQAAVLSFVLSRVVTFPIAGVRYPVFVYTGVVVVSYLNGVVASGSTAIVDGAGLTTKIYFPRVVLPLVSVVAGAYGLAVNVVLLLVAWVAFGSTLRWRVLLLPGAVAALVLLAAVFAVVLAAAHVYGRDVRFVVQAALVPLLYATPVFYPLDAIGSARFLVLANPATGVVEAFRVCLGGADPQWPIAVAVTACWILLMGVLGLQLHRRHDRLFVDLL